MAAELQLFCLWSKSRHVEERILCDLERELEIVFSKEMTFPGRMDVGFAAFYDVSVRTGARKVKNSGSKPFLLVIVRDPAPEYRNCTITGNRIGFVNPKIVELKNRYRRWAGGKGWCVHSTQDQNEFDRDVYRLTGHTGEEWRKGIPDGEIRPELGFDRIREVYAFTNRFGKVLSFYTEDFIAIEPKVAAKISPVPLDERAKYDVSTRIDDYPEIKVLIARGAVAALFYPAKRDDVKTVFFVRDGQCFVKKTVDKRTKKRERYGFRQLAIGPTPIYKGQSVRDRLAASNHTIEAYTKILTDYLDELMRQFPPLSNGNLPERTFDAIPQNCIIDSEGKYNFFDLEYDMVGGVPLAYLIERVVMTTIPRLSLETGTLNCSYALAERLAEQYKVALDWRAYWRVCKRNKLFNTRSPKRIATNCLLSLIPFRALRERLCWWSFTPELKK